MYSHLIIFLIILPVILIAAHDLKPLYEDISTTTNTIKVSTIEKIWKQYHPSSLKIVNNKLNPQYQSYLNSFLSIKAIIATGIFTISGLVLLAFSKTNRKRRIQQQDSSIRNRGNTKKMIMRKDKDKFKD